jgi:hypothetical protein
VLPAKRPAALLAAPTHFRTLAHGIFKRLLKGALLGSSGTFSTFTPQSGHFTRYISMCTVVLNSLQGRSRTARSLLS